MAEPHAITTQLVAELHEEATREAARMRLLELEPRPTEVLLDLLPTRSNRTQLEIVRILGHFRDARALPVLSALVSDEALPDARVRWAAIEALRRLESLEAMDVIEEHCSSMDLELRRRAREAFDNLRDLLRTQLDEDQVREDQSHVPPRADWDAPMAPRSFSLDELSPERVEALVDEIVDSPQAISRSELIRRVSRRFGRSYLIRVRKWTNRYVYRQAGLGRFQITNDLVERLP